MPSDQPISDNAFINDKLRQQFEELANRRGMANRRGTYTFEKGGCGRRGTPKLWDQSPTFSSVHFPRKPRDYERPKARATNSPEGAAVC